MDDFLKKIKAQVSDKEAMEHVKKIGEKIKKFGHTISGLSLIHISEPTRPY